MHEIVETATYLAAAERAGMSEEDRDFVAMCIAANPRAGDLIKGSNGVRKVRIARPNTGKSSGWRVLTAYVAEVEPVYLLTVYAKNQRANVSQAEINAWAKVMAELKKGAKEKT